MFDLKNLWNKFGIYAFSADLWVQDEWWQFAKCDSIVWDISGELNYNRIIVSVVLTLIYFRVYACLTYAK